MHGDHDDVVPYEQSGLI
ncbi:hypothetical protein P9E03_03305 [Bacillus mojavensis]|nr:hypothetical protein [Bacillus mojavensis]MCY9092376.1 hypothetical protein [Bacillus mojavensis]MEC1755396.1 hypothetical protein [Bacillus mojavensis]MEC1798126.1 hypothetical protein [Bacillus mojavensis]MEC3588188.1 hypothetical protein [Bacillus mojavensis]MEC5243843.1 hypothetical protein [Bacillus mojavensis]